jgi:hypothetical protein
VARLQAVIITAAMDEATRSGWCREQGLYPAELEAWKRDAIAGPSRAQLSNFIRAPKMAVSLESVLHNNGQRDKGALGNAQANRRHGRCHAAETTDPPCAA